MSTESAQPFTLLIVTPEGLVRHTLPAAGSVGVGRAEGNEVRIDEASVSRRHARIHLGAELRVEDLGGANGTHVQVREPVRGGQTQSLRPLRAESLPIAPGDRLMFGSVLAFVGRPKLDATGRGRTSARVVCDPHMVELDQQLKRAAASPLSVLLLGETGVGKEVFARALHENSPRKDGPFIAVNCAALPENLLEAELFGHEKGAFTGAVQSQNGLFESADGGSLFLDEIGELPLTTQAKLLRALEERKVVRVGGRSPREFDARLVCATNRDLEASAERGEFRSDLYFRIAGLSLFIPPLRERRLEILPLAELFLERVARELDREPLGLSPDVVTVLTQYSWPGNVRELRNTMQRAAVLAEGDQVKLAHLPPKLRREQPGPGLDPSEVAEPAEAAAPLNRDMDRLRGEMRDLERQRILSALERCAGNQTRAAEELGISRRTLVNRLREFELPRPRAKG